MLFAFFFARSSVSTSTPRASFSAASRCAKMVAHAFLPCAAVRHPVVLNQSISSFKLGNGLSQRSKPVGVTSMVSSFGVLPPKAHMRTPLPKCVSLNENAYKNVFGSTFVFEYISARTAILFVARTSLKPNLGCSCKSRRFSMMGSMWQAMISSKLR